ncbi:S8 family serine peptidase [Candidatus Woesearchaeota archaeon]|nr:S8 family serine peptidase [Candidatus Woesearchaeota archaeon]
MTSAMLPQKLRTAKKSAIFLLAVLLVLLAVSFLPFGGNSGTGNGRGSALLLEQIAAVDSLPPAVDAKIDPVVKEQVKEAIYAASVARTEKEAKDQSKVSVVVQSGKDVSGAVKSLNGVVAKKAPSVDKSSEFASVEIDAKTIAELAKNDNVIKVYPKVTYYPLLDESVPLIKADSFWNSGYKGSGVKVAVLDTGIDKNHPMLKGKVAAEKDFSNSGNTNDNFGHGTHVAGIIAGTTANGGKYSGVAPDAQLLSAKVIGDNGFGDNVDIIAGIGWAVDNGAKVISMSLGASSSLDASVDSAIKDAVAKGVIVVVSSGNCGSSCPSIKCGSFKGVTSPGSSPNAISVGAVDKSKNVACFSSGESISGVGIKPDFVAPGVGIKSSVPGGNYQAMDGTSMAAPHVSGAVALVLGKNPGFNQGDVMRVLEKTALELGSIGKDTSYGFGLIDLAKALAYKEGIEVSVEVEKQVISGASQKITVRVYDDVTVNSVKAAITKPNNAKADVTFSSSGGNVYTYDYSDTALMGNYVVDAAVNYGGAGGSSGTGSEGGGQPGSGTGETSSITVTRTAYFKVTSLTGDFGNVEQINVSQQQFLSQNLTANITFANTAAIELNFSALLQLLDNGTVMQEIRMQPVTIAANSKATAAVNNALDVGPGNYTLRILTDYGAGSLANETNITVADDLAPAVVKIGYGKTIKVKDAQVIIVQLYEHQKVSASLRLGKHDGQLMKPIITNYTTRAISEFGNNKTIAITIYNGSDLVGGSALNEGSGYTVTLQLCDESGNCAGKLDSGKKDAEFSITGCSGKSVLVAKTYDSASVFEEAAAAAGGLCTSVINKSVSGTPPSSYFEKFDAVVWTTGSDLVNIDSSDAAALMDYYGKKGKVAVEGSDVAFRHGSDSFMRDVLHSELKTDLGFTVTSVANMSKLGINVTRPHPVVAGLGSSMLFNATIDPFPDSVQPYNGSVELAVWSGLDAKGSAIVAYESDDGKAKSLLLPFSMEALNATAATALATSVLGWLLDESSADIEPAAISHGVLVDGQAAAIGVGIFATTGSQWVPAKPGIAVHVDGKVVSQAEVDMPSAGLYSHNFTTALSAGQHVVKVVANFNFSAKESNYVNNLGEYNLTVYPKEADLLLTGFSYSYNDSLGAIEARVNVSDLGGSAASSSLKAYLDGKEAASANVELSAGETKQVALELLSQKGVFQFKAVVDPDNKVAEHNESNNELTEKVYVCSREKVLVVDDNDAEFFSTPEPSSSDEFVQVLQNSGYCVDGWDEKEKGAPASSELGKYEVVVWSAGDYFNGTISNDDAIAIGNFSGGLLLEGSDVGLDNAGSGILQSIAAAAFSSDMLLNESQNESLVLRSHPITANVSNISISKEKSPYPDAVEAAAENAEVVAEWQSGKAAITAYTGSSKKTAYYAFSVDGITEPAAMEKLVTNTVQWLLVKPNNPPKLQNFTDGDDMSYDGIVPAAIKITMKEGETKNFSVVAEDPDGDPLAYKWLLNGTPVSAVYYFAFSPKYNESGSYNLTVIVSDGQAEARAELLITVLDVNRPATIKGVLISQPFSKKKQSGK